MGLLLELFGSQKKKFARDVRLLTAHLAQERDDLVPVTLREISELSAKSQPGKDYRAQWASFKTGRLVTVFHETLGSFGYRIYTPSSSSLVLMTHGYAYSYFITKHAVQILIQGEALATLRMNGDLYDRRGRKVIGRLDMTYRDTPELVIGDAHFGALQSINTAPEHHQRAVQIIKELPHGILELFMAVISYHTITQNTKLPKIHS